MLQVVWSTQFARGEMPEEILRGVKMGRMAALQKHDGGVRGIVVGGRGQMVGCPHNCTTVHRRSRGGDPPISVCFVHQGRHGMCCPCGTESDKHGQQCHHLVHQWGRGMRFHFEESHVRVWQIFPTVTNLSHSSGNFMRSLPTFVWEDELGEVHTIRQGEGGEQGDPLMPLLLCLGQHRALVSVQA